MSQLLTLIQKALLHSRRNGSTNGFMQPVYNNRIFLCIIEKEEVYTTTYSDFEEAKRALFSYISSISYLTPQEFGDLSREEIA
ncbi:hypothetical protein ACIL82_11565 [Enterococcus faecium]